MAGVSGMELISVELVRSRTWAYSLRDTTCADVHGLGGDVAPRVAASWREAAAAELLGWLRRWQKFQSLTSAATRMGTNLPMLIADVRARLSTNVIALAAFNDAC